MKIKMNCTVKCASTNVTFHQNKIYNASPATNQPRGLRLAKGKSGIHVNKVFVQKKEKGRGIASLLLEKEDFTIVDFPESDSVLENYLKSKEKTPRQKRVVKMGLKLRDGFRPMTNREQKNIKLAYCGMNTSEGRCTKFAKFIKVISRRVKVCNCEKHATTQEY